MKEVRGSQCSNCQKFKEVAKSSKRFKKFKESQKELEELRLCSSLKSVLTSLDGGVQMKNIERWVGNLERG